MIFPVPADSATGLLVGAGELESPTPALSGQCSDQLSYAPLGGRGLSNKNNAMITAIKSVVFISNSWNAQGESNPLY